MAECPHHVSRPFLPKRGRAIRSSRLEAHVAHVERISADYLFARLRWSTTRLLIVDARRRRRPEVRFPSPRVLPPSTVQWTINAPSIVPGSSSWFLLRAASVALIGGGLSDRVQCGCRPERARVPESQAGNWFASEAGVRERGSKRGREAASANERGTVAEEQRRRRAAATAAHAAHMSRETRPAPLLCLSLSLSCSRSLLPRCSSVMIASILPDAPA